MVVIIDSVPVLVFVTMDLQLRFFFDVAALNFLFQLGFALMRKFQINFVAFP